jgi:tellurite resistance protein
MDMDRLEKTRNVLKNVDGIVSRLEEVTMTDGTVSKDEKKLISGIRSTLVSYRRHVEAALEDGEVTKQEYTKIRSSELEVMRSAIRVAYMDGIITEEEDAVLLSLEEQFKLLESI